MNKPSTKSLLAAIFPPKGEDAPEVFAVLDGARDERIYTKVYESRLEVECLFAGELSYDLASAAPYLVRLSPEAEFTSWLLGAWGGSLGIFAWSRAGIEAMRRHLRRILQVKDEAGKKLYFRYYDPRVLRLYLPTCTAAELHYVLGPMGRVLLEGEGGQVLSCEPSTMGGPKGSPQTPPSAKE